MKVSCIMVTGHQKERRWLAQMAIECFNAQTHKEKELVIVNEGECFGVGKEVIVQSGQTLGELRNIGLEQATGDYVMQWDDDDWYHPNRIKLQLSAVKKNYAVILRNEIVCDLKTGVARVCNTSHWKYGGFPGTILHNKHTPYRYPLKYKGEDSDFIQQFNCISINNDPCIYIRMFHGNNTWDSKHYCNLGKRSRKLTNQEQKHLTNIVNKYYNARDSYLSL